MSWIINLKNKIVITTNNFFFWLRNFNLPNRIMVRWLRRRFNKAMEECEEEFKQLYFGILHKKCSFPWGITKQEDIRELSRILDTYQKKSNEAVEFLTWCQLMTEINAIGEFVVPFQHKTHYLDRLLRQAYEFVEEKLTKQQMVDLIYYKLRPVSITTPISSYFEDIVAFTDDAFSIQASTDIDLFRRSVNGTAGDWEPKKEWVRKQLPSLSIRRKESIGDWDYIGTWWQGQGE